MFFREDAGQASKFYRPITGQVGALCEWQGYSLFQVRELYKKDFRVIVPKKEKIHL